MVKFNASYTLFLVLASSCLLLANDPSHITSTLNSEYQSPENDASNPCITEQQYSMIEARSTKNRRSLNIVSGQFSATENSITLLDWPLRAAQDLHDCSYYHISAYVDQNISTGATQDFNCSTNTYDGHRGTDISIWPFNFYKMDNDLVEVIAAAPGIIIDKHDGEFDRNCSATTMTANYMLIQHADGSHALYWHMKNGSITTKAIGQSVTPGEYIGVVGSSGSSSGPHLHFEIWSAGTVATRVDPFVGSCNLLNTSTWWIAQKPHKEPAVIKASVHTTDAVFPGCPTTETLNESTAFQVPFQGPGLPAGYAKFYIFLRNETTGMTADMSILNPNGSTYLNWTYTSATDVKARAWAWSKVLPTIPGTYTFRAIYNGITCSSDFEITSLTGIKGLAEATEIRVYPIPSNGKIFIENAYGAKIEVYNLLGNKIVDKEITNQKTELNLGTKSGIYFYKLINEQGYVNSGKIIVQ